jgi:hypothetical protein
MMVSFSPRAEMRPYQMASSRQYQLASSSCCCSLAKARFAPGRVGGLKGGRGEAQAADKLSN